MKGMLRTPWPDQKATPFWSGFFYARPLRATGKKNSKWAAFLIQVRPW